MLVEAQANEGDLSLEFFESIVNDLFLDSEELISLPATPIEETQVRPIAKGKDYVVTMAKKEAPVDLRKQEFSKLLSGVTIAPAPAPLPKPFVAPAPAPLPLPEFASNQESSLPPLSPMVDWVDDTNLVKRKREEKEDKNERKAIPAPKKQALSTKSTGSKFRGISMTKDRYRARIKINRKTTHLGYYTTEEEAAHAYDRAAYVIRGESAKTNFPVSAADIPEFPAGLDIKDKVIIAARSVGEAI